MQSTASSSMINFYMAERAVMMGVEYQKYRLNTQYLSSNNVYLIFFEPNMENYLVIDALKNITFSSAPDKYKYECKEFKGVKVQAFSMPVEFLKTCEKCAKHYGLETSHISQTALSSNHISLVIPNDDRILVIRGNYSAKVHKREKEALGWLGKSFDKLGID